MAVSPTSLMNTLYYGDNLKILRDHIKDESVDLIYLDPHTGGNTTVRECVSSHNYPNAARLFKDESGTEADSQIPAFYFSIRMPAIW